MKARAKLLATWGSPIGGGVFYSVFLPILIEQYPEWFKTNPAALPLIGIAVAVCFLPAIWLAIAWFYHYVYESRLGKTNHIMATILVSLVAGVLAALLAGVSYHLFVRHERHLAKRAAEEQKPHLDSGPANEAAPINLKPNTGRAENSKNAVPTKPRPTERPKTTGIAIERGHDIKIEDNVFEGLDEAISAKDVTQLRARGNVTIGSGGQIPQAAPTAEQKRKYAAMSNKELSSEALVLAAQLRDLQAAWRTRSRNYLDEESLAMRQLGAPPWDQTKADEIHAKYVGSEQKLREEIKGEYANKYRTHAVALADALESRVTVSGRKPVLLRTGVLAGVDPLDAVADYLEALSRALPEDK